MPNETPRTPAALTVEQEAGLGSGAAFWKTKSLPGIPSFTLTDGPHGVRRQTGSDDHLGVAPSLPATCFPPAVGIAQSWNVDLIERIGAALGAEAASRGVGVLLGPGVNIKRDPRCGRNFEYFSEDPLLSGDLGAAWVRGLQSQGVGASVKHLAANNVEHDRMRSSSDVDSRTLREIYLRPFQRVVEKAEPWTVMCSYNRINGRYTGEDRWLLTDVLRGEWGFDGVVVSDWGAVRDRVASVAAGLDLEMPAASGTDDSVVAAVHDGRLDRSLVAASAHRVSALAQRIAAQGSPGAEETDAHHALAREAAAQSIVLLANDGLLPLAGGGRLAVIGEFAERPRYQGGGSSRVTATRVDIPLEEIRRAAGDTEIRFARGFDTTAPSDDAAAAHIEAVTVAAECDAAVLFLGLGDGQESEGFDRENIDLPADQWALLDAVLDVQPRTVVVLSHGGVLRIAPMAGVVPAILDAALLGQGGGAAIADVLFGTVNPSGRLAESVPERLQDTPSYLNFPGEHSHVLYGEGLHVGYRWYDARDIDVTYPFGHGLSYTRFEYSDLALRRTPDGIEVRVDITNTGARDGREVVQFYSSLPSSQVVRPIRELIAFASVDVATGATETVTVTIPLADLAYWDRRIDGWVVEQGRYRVDAAASSRDLRIGATIEVERVGAPVPITRDTTIGEAMQDPSARAVLGRILSRGDEGGAPDAAETELGIDVARMMAGYPIGRLPHFSGPAGQALLADLLDRIAHPS
jgi:beta-glucosidase